MERCRFLEFPAELRNRIYGFVFEDSAPSTIDLFEAKAHLPDSSILLACRQLHKETKKLCREARNNLWLSHHFTVNILPRQWKGELNHHVQRMDEIYRAERGFAKRCRRAQGHGKIQHLTVTSHIIFASGEFETYHLDSAASRMAVTHGDCATPTRGAHEIGTSIFDRAHERYKEVVVPAGDALDVARIVRELIGV